MEEIQLSTVTVQLHQGTKNTKKKMVQRMQRKDNLKEDENKEDQIEIERQWESGQMALQET